MSNDASLLWVAVVFLLLVVVLLWVFNFRREQQRQEELAQHKREIETLKQTVGALCSSAVGVDKRVNRLERQGRDLEERQESMEQHTQYGEPPYADAIRMVREGAGPEQLVNELGISRDAADLIIMMHGARRESID
jgi:flagellar biosynthesis/type III secretory pathway M-ring protein FliF/YscJ